MAHAEEVLKKMAEFHAASACYVEHYGMFSADFTQGIFCEQNRGLLREFNVSTAFLNQLKNWKNCQKYYEKLVAYMVVSKVLPVVILEKTDQASLENCIHDESKLKAAMFSNRKYVQSMLEILPWLDNRGLLDWQ
ncbi:hypothetical protein EVAR_71634_1 [Eumeta japonica]|uniref:CHK kinase-like domain-containing protein n=1 Tax=Eumeta variegata TaxID=151549 RepID=A0A4C1TT73_EUMVA|nr:hypothetical protein EVAR_71634_1 [Eumeta japonica]